MTDTILNLCCLSSHPEKTEGEGRGGLLEGGAYFKFWPIGGVLIRVGRGRLFEDLRHIDQFFPYMSLCLCHSLLCLYVVLLPAGARGNKCQFTS